MSTRRALRGGCQCGRNVYVVQPPPDSVEVARLLFDPTPSHRTSLASPLPAYLRVPLAWYHSTTLPHFSDETQSMIHRSYEHPIPGGAISSTSTRRHFCGFCGTPLSFWSETPQPEADYIRLTLGSLRPDDLDELDEWTGAADESEEAEDGGDEGGGDGDENRDSNNATAESPKSGRPGDGALDRILSTTGIPWFDSFVEGSRLGRHLLRQQRLQLKQRNARASGARVRRHDVGSAQSADGSVRVEWEVREWIEGDDGEQDEEGEEEEEDKKDAEHGSMDIRAGNVTSTRSSEPSPAKRARLGDAESEGGVGSMDME
ncbi:hypothetical protein SEPCBS119000_002126 [Sporothrix epigloea]|uniref:CENP-V/GFA domain-containing protein n=1 Tax=Sporothrix epigloea TaxID=1892477 RepID=A0ABP0DHR0_9PEZI